MAGTQYRVGIIGLQPERSWAARAHLPALRALSDHFEVVGVANSSLESSEAAAKACNLPRAFDGVDELVASPEIDIVAVTVKVPHHFELVKKALEAGKHVLCEWPLGNGLAEAEEVAAIARKQGVLAVVDTQARLAPEIQYARQLIDDGYVGEIFATSLRGYGRGWGATITSEKAEGYLLDSDNGATLLTIPIGHTLAALREMMGNVSEVSSTITTRRGTVRSLESGAMLPMTAPDQVLVQGRMASGAMLDLHYQGGVPRGTEGLVWDITGSEGDLRITAKPSGHVQMVPLELYGVRGEESELKRLDVPTALKQGWPDDVIPGNVARVYARVAADLREGTHTAPTFDDAVYLHRLIDTIEQAAAQGRQLTPPQTA